MVVLEIRNDRILVVEGQASKRKVVVKKTHIIEFDSDMITSAGVINPLEMADLIVNELKANKISTKGDFSICFNQFNSIFREIKVPAVEGKKLNVLVRSEMINTLNLSNDYFVDYIVLNEEFQEEGHFYNILAVAISQDYFESFMAMSRHAKFNLKVADFSTNTIIKMMEASTHLHVNQLTIVLTISPQHLRMYLFDGYDYVFTRNVFLDGDDDFELEVLDNLTRMIQFMYTRTRLSTHDKRKVILTGDESRYDSLIEAIEKNIDVSCSTYTMPELIQNQSDDSLQLFINTIGTLIRRDKK